MSYFTYIWKQEQIDPKSHQEVRCITPLQSVLKEKRSDRLLNPHFKKVSHYNGFGKVYHFLESGNVGNIIKSKLRFPCF